MSSENRFGYEWDRYHFMSPAYERQFRNWTHPMTPDDWKGKSVLDAGCGMGRNSYWPLKWGAASLTAFDHDERSVARAKETLKEFPQASVVFRDIYTIDWKSEFDVAFSIGVIHHLKDPQRAVSRLVDALKTGGKLILWVYSYEGNEWIVRFVNPVRINITSKLPLSLVHFLSYGLSIPLWIFVKLFRSPSNYFRQLSTFSLWHIHSIVFDQLIPDVANYWTKEEAKRLVENMPLRNLYAERTPEGTGWIVTGTKV